MNYKFNYGIIVLFSVMMQKHQNLSRSILIANETKVRTNGKYTFIISAQNILEKLVYIFYFISINGLKIAGSKTNETEQYLLGHLPSNPIVLPDILPHRLNPAADIVLY